MQSNCSDEVERMERPSIWLGSRPWRDACQPGRLWSGLISGTPSKANERDGWQATIMAGDALSIPPKAAAHRRSMG